MRWLWARLLGQSGPAGLAREGLCQTRLPCALNTVFIAAGLLVCLVGD